MQQNNNQSANQLFKNFLEESGKADLPKKEKDALFKTWLQDAIQTGTLQGTLDKVKEKINQSGNTDTQMPNATEQKPFRPLGMHPVTGTLVIFGVTSLVVWGIVETVKYFKKK